MSMVRDELVVVDPAELVDASVLEVLLPLPLLPHAVSAIPVAASKLAATRDDSRKCRRCMPTVCRTNDGGVES